MTHRPILVFGARSLMLCSPAAQNDVDISRCVMAASCGFRLHRSGFEVLGRADTSGLFYRPGGADNH